MRPFCAHCSSHESNRFQFEDKSAKNPSPFTHTKLCFLFNYRGVDFRTDYGKLGVLCAMFPEIPVLAMRATSSRSDMKCIQDSLGLKNWKHIATNPDRKNICYKKIFRSGQDVDAI